MGKARPLTGFDRLSLVGVGIVAGVVGVFLLGVAVLQKTPTSSEVRQVSGRLLSYSFHTSGKNSFVVLLTIEGAPHRYWTNVLRRKEAAQVLGGAARVSLYSEERPTYRPIDGAYKGYGLWIDGRPVQTLESALSADTFFHHVTLPFVGLGFLGMAFLVGKRLRPSTG